MPRNKGGLWEATKAGKFWHEHEPKPDPKPEPAPEQPKKTKLKSAMAKKILEAKAKKEKDFPNRENTQVKSSKTSGKSQPGCTKRTNISPKKGNLASSEPEAEKKVDIQYVEHSTHPVERVFELFFCHGLIEHVEFESTRFPPFHPVFKEVTEPIHEFVKHGSLLRKPQAWRQFRQM